ncbi:MAG: ECF transporter S component [Cellulosilyticaceae bacterium]
MKHKKNFSTKQMVLIGLFSSICYIMLYFKIPIPAPVGNPFLHMGNMFVILAALLFSGSIGGISGSIGMGLFDALNGWIDSVPKTIVLKFGIGFITGVVASKGHNSNAKSPIKWLILSSIFFISVGVMLFYASTSYGTEIYFENIDKVLVLIPVLYIFSLLLGLGLAISCAFIKKINIKLQYAIIGATAGIIFNLIGEFIFGFLKLILLGSGFTPAILSSLFSLPSTLINGTFSVVVAIALYIPLSKILNRLNFKL